MAKQVILYDEASDAVSFAPLAADTFALKKGTDGTYESMTYNEWEALRCKQACDAVVAKLAESGLDEQGRKDVASRLEEFSATMQQKYLEGNRSWAQLFELLAKDLEALA